MFDWIDIQPDEPAARGNARQQFPGVPAEAERAIRDVFAGLEGEHLENLGHHDGPVAAGGRPARSEHFGHVGGVTLRVEFLVFIREAPGILARVARAPLVRGRRSRLRLRGFGVRHRGIVYTHETAAVWKGYTG